MCWLKKTQNSPPSHPKFRPMIQTRPGRPWQAMAGHLAGQHRQAVAAMAATASIMGDERRAPAGRRPRGLATCDRLLLLGREIWEMVGLLKENIDRLSGRLVLAQE